jgi:hypothetical protein
LRCERVVADAHLGSACGALLRRRPLSRSSGVDGSASSWPCLENARATRAIFHRRGFRGRFERSGNGLRRSEIHPIVE